MRKEEEGEPQDTQEGRSKTYTRRQERRWKEPMHVLMQVLVHMRLRVKLTRGKSMLPCDCYTRCRHPTRASVRRQLASSRPNLSLLVSCCSFLSPAALLLCRRHSLALLVCSRHVGPRKWTRVRPSARPRGDRTSGRAPSRGSRPLSSDADGLLVPHCLFFAGLASWRQQP